jgi:hypothetical protein
VRLAFLKTSFGNRLQRLDRLLSLSRESSNVPFRGTCATGFLKGKKSAKTVWDGIGTRLNFLPPEA